MKLQTQHSTSSLLKTLCIIMLYAASFLNSLDGSAQRLETSFGVQETVMGLQKGYEIKVHLTQKLTVGAFHQASDAFKFEGNAENYPFTGVIVQRTLAGCGNITVQGKIKMGMVNQQFVAVVPELETQINVLPFAKVGFGMGYRGGKPAIGTSISMKLGK